MIRTIPREMGYTSCGKQGASLGGAINRSNLAIIRPSPSCLFIQVNRFPSNPKSNKSQAFNVSQAWNIEVMRGQKGPPCLPSYANTRLKSLQTNHSAKQIA